MTRSLTYSQTNIKEPKSEFYDKLVEHIIVVGDTPPTIGSYIASQEMNKIKKLLEGKPSHVLNGLRAHIMQQLSSEQQQHVGKGLEVAKVAEALDALKWLAGKGGASAFGAFLTSSAASEARKWLDDV